MGLRAHATNLLGDVAKLFDHENTEPTPIAAMLAPIGDR